MEYNNICEKRYLLFRLSPYMLKKLINAGGSLYTFKSFLYRFIGTSAIGIISSMLIITSLFGWKELLLLDKDFYITVIIVYLCISEGVVFIHYLLDKKYPDFKDLYKRFGRQITFSICWFFLVFAISFFVHIEEKATEAEAFRAFILFIAFGTVFVYILTLDLLAVKIIIGYREAEKNIETLKREKLKLAYQSLQDQINPHFLFNNLSVLISEIQYNQDNAVEFTQKLANVYRYVLDNRDKIIVDLKSEADFVKAFIFLHKTRLGDGINIIIEEGDDMRNMMVPPLSVQTLIENAIKHNITDVDRPLTIEVYGEEDKVCVKNNLQPKACTYSTNTGLTNLKKRYGILGDYEVEVIKGEDYFLVKIPIIDKDKCCNDECR